jgi:hypothetical protein
VPSRAHRPHRRNHLTDHLVGQLPNPTITDHTGDLGRLHIPASSLPIHPRLSGHRTQPSTRQPPA